MSVVELTPELEGRLQEVAARVGRSRSELVAQALENFLDDIADLRSAEEALAEIRAGRASTTSLDEVERELGLAGRDR